MPKRVGVRVLSLALEFIDGRVPHWMRRRRALRLDVARKARSPALRADGFVLKPFKIAAVLDVVGRLLKRAST